MDLYPIKIKMETPTVNEVKEGLLKNIRIIIEQKEKVEEELKRINELIKYYEKLKEI